jgi:hypothetical protein
MNQSDFAGTEMALLLMTIAYNFLSLFKQIIIGGNVGNRLKTLRYKMFPIPSIIEQFEDKVICLHGSTHESAELDTQTV